MPSSRSRHSATRRSCVPPGSGLRVAVDRDGDGFFDRDEIDAGTDPAEPLSFPPTIVWCAEAPAKMSGTNDTVDNFVAQPRTPAPAGCPPLP